MTSPAEDPINIVVYAYSNMLIAIYSVSYMGTAILISSKMEDNAQKFIWKYKMVFSYFIVLFPTIHSINTKLSRANLSVNKNLSFAWTQLCLYSVRSSERRKVINDKYKSKGSMVRTER